MTSYRARLVTGLPDVDTPMVNRIDGLETH
jgi:hypothetical protein